MVAAGILVLTLLLRGLGFAASVPPTQTLPLLDDSIVKGSYIAELESEGVSTGHGCPKSPSYANDLHRISKVS